MKKNHFLLIFVLSVISISTTQAQCFNPAARATISRGVNHALIKKITFDGNFAINEHFSAGPSIGLGTFKIQDDMYTNPEELRFQKSLMLPVSANLKYYFRPQNKVSAFVFGQVGYTFDLCKNYALWKEDKYVKDIFDKMGLNMTIGAGVDVAVPHGSLQLSIDWDVQKIKECYMANDPYTSESFYGVSVAYKWGNRKLNKKN